LLELDFLQAAIESVSNQQITQINHSNDEKSKLVSLLLPVNTRRVGLRHWCFESAKILARARFGRICQNGQTLDLPELEPKSGQPYHKVTFCSTEFNEIYREYLQYGRE